MLYGISPLLSPDLVATLMRMGHGDALLLTDANYPAAALPALVHRADGLTVASLLGAIAAHFPLDTQGAWNCAVMESAGGEDTAMRVYRPILKDAGANVIEKAFERYAFYDIAKRAYAAVYTGDSLSRGNLVIAKGVVIPK